MVKKYIIKSYDSTGTTLQKVFNPNDLKNDPSFSSRISGGFGELRLDLNLPFDDFDEGVSIEYMNIIKVYEIDEDNLSGRLIYVGFVSAYTPYLQGADQGVVVIVLGLVSLLQFAFYKTGGGAFTVPHTSDSPGTIFKAIIDHFNTIYSGSLLSYGSGDTTIDTTGTTIDYDFINKKWLEAVKENAKQTGAGWWWSIDKSGVAFLKQKPASATHAFTIQKDLEALRIEKSSESVINQVKLTYNGGDTSDSDAMSKTSFGTREALIDDQAIDTGGTATKRVDKELNDNKDARLKATLKINSTFDFETIKVGDTCKIQNLKLGSNVFGNNMLIVKVAYTPDFVTLELEEINVEFGVEIDKFVNS